MLYVFPSPFLLAVSFRPSKFIRSVLPVFPLHPYIQQSLWQALRIKNTQRFRFNLRFNINLHKTLVNTGRNRRRGVDGKLGLGLLRTACFLS